MQSLRAAGLEPRLNYASVLAKEIFYSPFLAGGKWDTPHSSAFQKPPTAEKWAFFMFKNMATIDIDDVFCTQFTRHEWMLFLNICSKIDANKEAFISMKELEKSTQWHYQKVLVNAERLVKMGLIENAPTEDTSGNEKVFYKVLASNVRYNPGEVPKNGFSPRMPQNTPMKQKPESKPIPVVVDVKKRKRTPVLISQKAERVNF